VHFLHITVLGISCKVLVTQGVQGGLCGKRSLYAPCWTQPVSASSAVDLSQDTAEPIGQTGGISVKTYLRKGRKFHRERRRGNQKTEIQKRDHQGQRIRRCSMAKQTPPPPEGISVISLFLLALFLCGTLRSYAGAGTPQEGLQL